MSLTRNRILPWGVLTAAALFPAAAPAQPVTYTGSGFVFPDNDPAGATGTVTVPDGFTLGAVSVSINFAGVTDPARHTWAGDVTATLSNGTSTITLFQRLGKTAVGTGFGDDSNLNGAYTFDDSAALRLIDSAKTVGGTDAAAGDIPVGSYWATNNI